MEYQITLQEDSYFRFTNSPMVTDSITPMEEPAPIIETPVIEAPVRNAGPQPVPIENPRSTSIHWFEGTPWSTNPNF